MSLLKYFEEQGKSVEQLARELFTLNNKPMGEIATWVSGLSWHEKKIVEAVTETAAQEFGFEI